MNYVENIYLDFNKDYLTFKDCDETLSCRSFTQFQTDEYFNIFIKRPKESVDI